MSEPKKPLAALAYATPDREPKAGGEFSDRVVGVNVRLVDNLMQIAFIVGGGAIGCAYARVFMLGAWWEVGAILGGLVGLLLSGTYLAVYRRIRRRV